LGSGYEEGVHGSDILPFQPRVWGEVFSCTGSTQSIRIMGISVQEGLLTVGDLKGACVLRRFVLWQVHERPWPCGGDSALVFFLFAT